MEHVILHNKYKLCFFCAKCVEHVILHNNSKYCFLCAKCKEQHFTLKCRARPFTQQIWWNASLYTKCWVEHVLLHNKFDGTRHFTQNIGWNTFFYTTYLVERVIFHNKCGLSVFCFQVKFLFSFQLEVNSTKTSSRCH